MTIGCAPVSPLELVSRIVSSAAELKKESSQEDFEHRFRQLKPSEQEFVKLHVLESAEVLKRLAATVERITNEY